MQENYKNLVQEKIGEASNVEDGDAADGEVDFEHSAPQISPAEDDALFYKAVGGSKKGRVYGLGSEGVLVAAAQSTPIFTPHAPNLQPLAKDVIATPSFKKAIAEILDERERQAIERQRESDRQLLQLQSQLVVVLDTLKALGSQISPTPPTNQSSCPSAPQYNSMMNVYNG